jgi:1,4-alpha-glucan branching enzyme
MTDAGVINRRVRVPPADLERLIGMFHADPHSILGAHPGPDGVTIRVFRPEAKQISVIDDEDRSWPMTRSDARGLFEVLIPNRGDVFRYQLRIVEAAGNVLTIRDAYAFLPTIGSLDLHLWNEGRHLQIYEKLGAHFHEIEGASGFTFAVWAPNARSISVVGDFNDWD